MGAPARFLVVEDERLAERLVTRQLCKYGEVHCARTVADAAEAARNDRWSGFLVDYRLPDGTGLQFLERLRDVHDVDVADTAWLTTAYPDDNLPSRVAALGFMFLAKPYDVTKLDRWALRRIAAQYLTEQPSALVAELAYRHELSCMQTRVVALEVAAVPRGEWPRILGIKITSINTYVKRVLAATQALSLHQLAQPIVRAVLARPSDTAVD